MQSVHENRKKITGPDAAASNAYVAGRIEALRVRFGFSRVQLARELGVHPSYVTRLLGGERDWKMQHINRLATLFNVPPGVLVGDGPGCTDAALDDAERAAANTDAERSAEERV